MLMDVDKLSNVFQHTVQKQTGQERNTCRSESVPMALGQSPGTIVKLNVGGRTFSTTRHTLTKDGPNFFTALLDGRVPGLQDEQGAYFLDQSPEHFAMILDYLRTGIMRWPVNMQECDAVARLADMLLINIDPVNHCAGQIRTQEALWNMINAVPPGGTLRMSNLTFIGVSFEGKFQDALFNGTIFKNCTFRNAELAGCKLIGAQFIHCDLMETEFSFCDLSGSEFADCTGHRLDLKQCEGGFDIWRGTYRRILYSSSEESFSCRIIKARIENGTFNGQTGRMFGLLIACEVAKCTFNLGTWDIDRSDVRGCTWESVEGKAHFTHTRLHGCRFIEMKLNSGYMAHCRLECCTFDVKDDPSKKHSNNLFVFSNSFKFHDVYVDSNKTGGHYDRPKAIQNFVTELRQRDTVNPHMHVCEFNGYKDPHAPLPKE
eukprot:Clim_evm34s141 gene=Clim_evmTU34s141